jgi:glycosyltransferase involved in cell wall biosynthesis
MARLDVSFDPASPADARLCFIEGRPRVDDNIPMVQRLDGIYFNSEQDFRALNASIKRTYENADGVIFQSEFNKRLTIKYFGEHPNSTVIHNGADAEFISEVEPLRTRKIDRFERVWCCASSWRPHKRLNDNINYFLEHSSEKDCLVIAGKAIEKVPRGERIFYVGEINITQLISLYKRADYFVHLAWLDHCPNVVVDARASGCKIICSSTGGTKEVAGIDATVIDEEEWDFKPLALYEPPKMNFANTIEHKLESDYNMVSVAEKYKLFMEVARDR